jgi:DNA polymerase I
MLAFFDVSNMCHGAFYGDKRNENPEQTDIIYGFFLTLFSIAEKNRADRIHPIFCFDTPPYKRSFVFPGYKQRKDKEREPMIEEARNVMFEQIKTLRDSILPFLGFEKQCWHLPGYEADDLMAIGALYAPGNSKSLIVSSDEDLYQLLDVADIYSLSTKKLMTQQRLLDEYQLSRPELWAKVKALSGCKSDMVPGVNGVGEKTAIKFLNGELKNTFKTYIAIREFKNRGGIEQNLPLTKLPFEGLDIKDIPYEGMSQPHGLVRDKLVEFFETYDYKRFLSQINKICYNFGIKR